MSSIPQFTKKMAVAILAIVVVFLGIGAGPASATELLADTFTGTTIDGTKWTETDAGGTGGTTGNIQQNGALSVSGSSVWGANYLASVATFDRSSNDVTLDLDATCNTGGIPGIGYGDPGVLTGGGDSYTVYWVGATVYLSRQHANANAENVAAYTCTNNVPFHIKLVIIHGSGASLYIDGSGTPAASVTGGTFTNKSFFLEGHTGVVLLDNVSVTGVNDTTVPDAPTALAGTPASTQIALTWTAPSNNGGAAISDYIVEYKLSSDSSWSIFTDGVTTSTSATVTGLTNGLSYDFRVSAENSVGTSTPSSVASSTPALSTPSAPRSLSASPGSQQVELTWISPLSDGGASTTDYIVEYKQTTEPSAWTLFSDGISTATGTTVTGLTNGLSYDFRVSAENSVGTSTPSSVVTATPLLASLIDSFTGTTIDTDKWTESDSTGIGGTTGKVQQNGSLTVTPTAGNWAAQDGIQTVSTYDRTDGDVSMEVSVSRDTCGSGVGTVAFGYGDMNFTQAGSSAYIFISNSTRWEVYYWNNGGNVAGSGGSASPQTLSGITSCTNGVPITFKLVALESGGVSIYVNGSTTPSATLAAGTFTNKPFWIGGYQSGGTVTYDDVVIVEPVAGPFPPTDLQATSGDSQVSLGWTAGSDNGAAISDYLIEYKPAASSSWNTFSDGVSTMLSTVVTGLSNGTSYNFRVSGINSNGTSLPSSPATATPFSSTPTAPTATSVSITGTAAVGEILAGTYTFSDANGNSEGSSQYRWLRADTAGGTYTAIAGATSSHYTVVSDDLNKYLKFEVTPVATVSPTTGSAVLSAASSQVSQIDFLNIIVSTGQSLSVGVGGSPALSTTQPYDNVMLTGSGGGMGAGTSLTPLIESSVETMGSAMANSITANASDNNYQVALTNHGVSGYTYSQLKKGTSPYNTGMTQITNVKNAATLAGQQARVVAFTTIHGETDNFNNVSGPTYEGYLEEWQDDLQTDAEAITGQSGIIPFFTDQMSSSFSSYANKATSEIPIYQLAAAEDHPGTFYLVAPKYFFNYSDRHHLTAASYRWLGEYYGKVMKKVLIDHEEWKPLSPDSVIRNGNVIYARFHVPAGSLVFDTTLEQPKDNMGFEYFDNSSSATISSVEIVGTDTVKVTLSSTPTGANQRLRYAYTGTVGVDAGSHSAGASGGNLRDTDTYPSLYGNTLYDWSVIFDKAITVDATAPVVSGRVANGISSSAATIEWTTDEASDSRVQYGPTDSYGVTTTLTDTEGVTSHSVALSGLVACADYHYRVISKDIGTNTATSSDASFTTTGCTANAPTTASTTAAVTTASGSTVTLTTSATEELTLDVPAAYTSTTTSAVFQARQYPKADFFLDTSAPTNLTSVGNYVYNLKALVDATTTLSTFDQPLAVTFKYDPLSLGSVPESTLVIYRYDGNSWYSLANCSVDTVAHTVMCETEAFSDFALFGVPSATTPTQSSSHHHTISIPADASASGVVPSAVATFVTDLTLGMTHPDVLLLQRYLNAHGFVVSSSGAGSVGNETNFFGVLTKTAVARFQAAHEITPAAGFFGPLTRAVVNGTAALGSSEPTVATSTQPVAYTRDLDLGDTGEDVRSLQRYLNTHGYVIAPAGPGAPGNETLIYGYATQFAVKQFQKAHGITPATGYFGPKTRGVLSL